MRASQWGLWFFEVHDFPLVWGRPKTTNKTREGARVLWQGEGKGTHKGPIANLSELWMMSRGVPILKSWLEWPAIPVEMSMVLKDSREGLHPRLQANLDERDFTLALGLWAQL